MSERLRPAAAVAALGLGAVIWSVMVGDEAPGVLLFVAAAAMPLSVLLAVRARLEIPFPTRAFVGGAIVGPVVALASHAFVAAFAAAFFVGFADTGRHLLESLRADPRLTSILASPWVILLLIEVSAVAPLTEEAGKALGAGFLRPRDRREAFAAGVAAGAGFAVVENILYATLGAAYGGPWPAVVAARALGAGVHPLASGIVMLGWWEWRQERSLVGLAKRFLTGAGVHALWNGSLVALTVVETTLLGGGTGSSLGPVALAYAGALGVAFAGVLWVLTSAVVAGPTAIPRLRFDEGRAVGAWIVLAASMLVPVVILVLAFPGFYLG